MMQPELLQSSWPLYNIINSTQDQAGLHGLNMDFHVDHDHEFSPSITATEDSSGISSDSYFPTMFSDEFVEFPSLGDEMQVMFPIENIAHNMEGFESISGTAIEDMYRWLDESDGVGNFPSEVSMEGEDAWSSDPSTKSSEVSVVLPSVNPSLTLPGDDMEIDSQLSLCHLLKAQGEAMEMGQRELAEVIVGCINEKASPVGETLERVAFNLFQSTDNQGDYLKQESSKNYEAAWKVFYESFPYGRFAHFAANSAILEAMPDTVETIRIVDYDMGEGVQWPPMIEAIGRQQKALRLTSIKLEGYDCGFAPRQWRFEETKRRLYDHARYFGLKLTVEEMSIGDLVSEMEELKKRGVGREWLAFNCMIGLPHMGRRRSRSLVMEFLGVAKDLIANSAINKGVITFGDGEDGERIANCSGYGSFFNENLAHYQALFESMEWNFPVYLTEARIAMESLFVAPYVSSLSWLQKWEEVREGSVFQAGVGLEGWILSKENLLEAKEMVKEGETSYEVKIEGQNENEMVLEWRGTSLVRVSTWM